MLIATASNPGAADNTTPHHITPTAHLPVSSLVSIYSALPVVSEKGAHVIHRFVWSPTGKTNSHVVPVGKEGGRDSRSTGGALRSDTGGGGGGERANPSGGTHPGGTCERAEHGGGTAYRRFMTIDAGVRLECGRVFGSVVCEKQN